MTIFLVILISAALLCTLVAGFLFAFAVVVMPGIGALGDREYLRAFQVMDRVIQNNQPLFMLVWIGSVAALIAAAVLSQWHLDYLGRGLILGVLLAYLLGVQLPTMMINVPLNNRLQSLDLASLNEAELQTARANFEPRWNRWNAIRTLLAIGTSVVLIVVVHRL